MRKPVACVLLCAVVCALLSGCHGSMGLPEFVLPETFDESRAYEITFWAKNDTNKSQTNVYAKAIADFMALYPNIMVNMRLYTDYGRIYNDVITNIATGTTPNVCITYPDHIATYLTGKNTVVPLETLFHDAAYGLGGTALRYDGPTYDQVVPEFLQECIVAGQAYAIPYMRSTEACYVNKTMVEALGFTLPDVLTWDFVWEVSEAATKKDADGNYLINGQKTMIPFIYKSTDNMMIQMLRQLGAPYATGEGEIQIFSEETKSILYEVAKHVGTGAFSTFKISSYPANFLNAGQCIFAVDSTAGATWMGSHAPLLDISEDKLVEFETAVLPVPQFTPDTPAMISQGPSICLFNKADPQEVLASWLFAQYLLTNDVQIGYAQTEGYVPVTTKAQSDERYIDYLSRSGQDNDLYYDVKIRASQLLRSHTRDTFVTSVFNGSASLRNAAGQMIENVAKSIRRKQVVDETYMDTLFADMVSLYRLDQSGDSVEVKQEELGRLPMASIGLLTALGGIWLAFGVFTLHRTRKNRTK